MLLQSIHKSFQLVLTFFVKILSKPIVTFFTPKRYVKLKLELDRDIEQPYEDEVTKNIHRKYTNISKFSRFFHRQKMR